MNFLINLYSRDKSLVVADGGGKFVEKSRVCRVTGTQALLVQNVDYSFVTLLYQVANYLVVEIFHRFPLILLNVFFYTCQSFK